MKKSTRIFMRERAWDQNNDDNSVRLLNAETLSSQKGPQNPALSFQWVWGRWWEKKKRKARETGERMRKRKRNLWLMLRTTYENSQTAEPTVFGSVNYWSDVSLRASAAGCRTHASFSPVTRKCTIRLFSLALESASKCFDELVKNI